MAHTILDVGRDEQAGHGHQQHECEPLLPVTQLGPGPGQRRHNPTPDGRGPVQGSASLHFLDLITLTRLAYRIILQ